jgi:hypothetical protein
MSAADDLLAGLLANKDRKALAAWAADCAEHVLPLFEQRHPQDDRPRKAIEAARAYARGEIRVGVARQAALAAHAAAGMATDPAAIAAARAAGHAAATAHVARHALGPVMYATKAAGFAANAQEHDWQLQHLLELQGKA